MLRKEILGPIITLSSHNYKPIATLHACELLESPICTYINWYVIMVVMSQSISHRNRELLEENTVLYQKVKDVLEKTQEEKV